MRRLTITLTVAALLVSAAAALGQLDLARQEPGPGGARKHKPLRISGHAENLYPGASGQLRLRLKNPHPFKIVVRKIKVRVGDGAPGCAAAYLTVPRYKGRIRIRAKRRKRFALRATMSPAAPHSCQNARFPLTFRGRAVRP